MSINFNRNRTQVEYEHIININGFEELKLKKEDFKNHNLTNYEVQVLTSCLNDDALDFFYNGLISFSEGVDSIFLQRYSWATVKLYYSVFYMLRASLACNGIALLQNNGVYRLELKENQSPYKTTNDKYKSTHTGTISHYIDLFGTSDKLLSNPIEDKTTYEWLKDVREIINYRAASFSEPLWLDIWNKFAEALENNYLNDLLLLIQEDSDYIYCFQEEYAVVGIPIKRISNTIKEFFDCGLITRFDIEKKRYTKLLIKYDQRKIKILEQIFS